MLSEEQIRMLRQHLLEEANVLTNRVAREGRDRTEQEREELASTSAVMAALTTVLQDGFTFDWEFLDIVSGEVMIRFYRTAVDTEMSADYTEAELPPILAPLARGELNHASLSAEQQDALDEFLVEIDWEWVDTRDETIEAEWEED